MKYIITTILLLLLAGCIGTGVRSNSGVEHRTYNNRGSYVGKSIEYRHEIRHYDSRGKFIGKSIKR